MDLVKALGLVVRIARESADLTQDQLGARTGIHFTAIGRIERGEHQARIDTMNSVALGLGMSLSELVRRAEDLLKLRLDSRPNPPA